MIDKFCHLAEFVLIVYRVGRFAPMPSKFIILNITDNLAIGHPIDLCFFVVEYIILFMDMR